MQSGMLLAVITEFCNDFRTVLEGNANDLSANELSGGARISFVLHEIFATAVKSFDPFDVVKDVDIRTIMYNSSGSAPSLFVGTTAFEVIVKQQIKRLEDPSLKCITMVYEEMIRILGQLLQKSVSSIIYLMVRLSKCSVDADDDYARADFQTVPDAPGELLPVHRQLFQEAAEPHQ